MPELQIIASISEGCVSCHAVVIIYNPRPFVMCTHMTLEAFKRWNTIPALALCIGGVLMSWTNGSDGAVQDELAAAGDREAEGWDICPLLPDPRRRPEGQPLKNKGVYLMDYTTYACLRLNPGALAER